MRKLLLCYVVLLCTLTVSAEQVLLPDKAWEPLPDVPSLTTATPTETPVGPTPS